MASTGNDANDECAALKLNDLSVDPPSPTEHSKELPESKDMESSTETLHSDASTTTVEEMEEQTVRLYISGLARSTTKGCIEKYFAKHNASDVMLKDRGLHTPYKFAFLTVPQRFAQSILEESPHIIDGVPAHVEYTRTPLRLRPAKQKGVVNPKPIIPEVTPTPGGGPNGKATVRKLFLGGLSSSTTTTKLNAYFSSYGEVVDSCVMADSVSGRSRGFGFVTFADESSVHLVTKAGRFHQIGDRDVDVKPAIPRDVMARADGQKHALLAPPSGKHGCPPSPTSTAVPTGELGWFYGPLDGPGGHAQYALGAGAPAQWMACMPTGYAPAPPVATAMAPALVPAHGVPVYGGHVPASVPSAVVPTPMPYTHVPVATTFAPAPGFAPAVGGGWGVILPQGC